MKKKTLILVFLALSVILASCTGKVDTDKSVQENGLEYSIVTVEGMPCILVQSMTYNLYYVSSLDCDWSKYQGGQ